MGLWCEGFARLFGDDRAWQQCLGVGEDGEAAPVAGAQQAEAQRIPSGIPRLNFRLDAAAVGAEQECAYRWE